MTEPPVPIRVAVVGSGSATPEEERSAREVGRRLAEAGAVVVCGGLGGVMAAAARGAREVGGLTVGLLPGDDAGAANPWITLPVATGLGEARNALVVRTGEAVVAVGGSWGTLSEIAFARTAGRTVVTLGAPPVDGLGLPAAESPAEAVERALEAARRSRGPSS